MISKRVILFGLGQVGRVAAQQLLDAGFEIEAAYSRGIYIGEDLSEVLGRGVAGIPVVDVSEFDAERSSAAAALFCTTGAAQDLLVEPCQCLRAGINVVTIAEGGTYPWTYAPEISNTINRAGIEGMATLTSTGMTDTYMVHLPAVLASTVPGVRKISVSTSGDFGRLGACALQELPLGLPVEQVTEMLENAPADSPQPPSISGQCLEAMASLMGLGSGEISNEIGFVIADEDIEVKTTGALIQQGMIAGVREKVTMITTEGVELSIDFVAEIYADDKPEVQGVTIEDAAGQALTMRVGPTPGVEYTAAIAINRLFDVMEAEPGLRTIDKLSAPTFRPNQ